MKQLQTLVEGDEARRAVINDCAALIESEVRSKSGLSGLAVKTAFGVVKTLKPTIVVELVDGLLDEFIEQLQPHYERYQQEEASGGSLERFLGKRTDAVAESMLGVTDRRAERSTNKTLVKAYRKLRPKGKEHVVVAVPGVGRVLDKHIG